MDLYQFVEEGLNQIKDTESGIGGDNKIFDDLPEFFVNDKDEKITK